MVRILVFFILFSEAVWATEDLELERLSGYPEYKEDTKSFDRLRERGRIAQDEQVEQFIIQSNLALKEYRKQKKEIANPEKTKAYRQYVEEKYEDLAEKDAIEKSYGKAKKKLIALSRKGLVSESEELGLNQKTVRADIHKRVLYGGTPTFKALREGSKKSLGGGNFGAGASSSSTNNDSFSFPSPPPPPPPVMGNNGFGGYDENNGVDTNFNPPPMPVEPFDPNDIPPPPALPMDDSFLPPPDVNDF